MLEFWKANTFSFPSLAAMAKDYLTVQASSITAAPTIGINQKALFFKIGAGGVVRAGSPVVLPHAPLVLKLTPAAYVYSRYPL